MESNLCRCVRDRDRDSVGKDSLLYWPIILLLTIPGCVILKIPFSTTSASQPVGTQPLAHCGPLSRTLLQRGAPATCWHSCDKLRLSQDWLLVSHMGVCIYHFIRPTNFQSTTWPFPLIFTCASCAENICLTARSSVSQSKSCGTFNVKLH